MGRHRNTGKKGISVPTDYVRYYKLDDNAANTVVLDDTGNLNGVSIVNTATISTTTAKVGRGLQNSRLDFNLTALNIQSSINFWVKLNAITNSIICVNTYTTLVNTVAIQVVSGVLYLYGYQATPLQLNLGTVNLGDWVYITIQKPSTNTRTVYVNGVYKGSHSSNLLFTNGGLLRLNGKYDADGNYTGVSDELKIFNRLLSQEEITALYNSYL